MKYAVVEIQGQQYKVVEGKEILVNKLGEKALGPRVLLLVDGEKVEVGQPELEKVVVELKVLGEEKGKKLHVQKYRAKSRYRRKIGFRAEKTRLLVEKIG